VGLEWVPSLCFTTITALSPGDSAESDSMIVDLIEAEPQLLSAGLARWGGCAE
jgi:hypothetical protein